MVLKFFGRLKLPVPHGTGFMSSLKSVLDAGEEEKGF